MASSSSSLTLLFFLSLPFLSHSSQSCPDKVKYICPDSNGTSVQFPFTNNTKPNCGLCVLDCNNNTSSTIQCGDEQLPYKTKEIFPNTNTIVLVYPGLHKLLSNFCHIHQNDAIIIPNPPNTSFRIQHLIVFYRCRIGYAVEGPSTACGNDVVYGPYAEDLSPESIPSGCVDIQLPNSTSGDTFSIAYQILNESRWLDQSTGMLTYLKKGIRRPIFITVVSFVGTFLLISAILFLKRRELKDRFTSDNRRFETFLENYKSHSPKRYTYSDIKKMTNSLKEKLGEGGFGGVYKGKLLDGRLVAVKLLKHSKGNGEDFMNEVASISRTNHINVVTLLGFCCEGHKKALVYEFMANGSLEKFINNCGHSLPLTTLFCVALGIARGLEYLHQGCKTRILHFDIKPHNILLDEDFCPKISDFGLAKVRQQNKESKVSISGTRGTIGYIAPEMFCRHFGDVSHKSDVYSYGMMVLEIIGSRRRRIQDSNAECSSEVIFPQWIYEELENGDAVELDGVVQNLNDDEKMLKRKMIIVSLWCIQTVPTCRPSMSRVLQILEGSHELIEIPPMPSLASPPRPPFDSYGSSIMTPSKES